MKKRRIFFVVFVMVAALAALYGYREYNRGQIDTATARPDASVTATELLSAFEQDQPGANSKYLDKLIRVSDRLREWSADENGFYTLTLGSEEGLSSVRCSMDSSFAANVGLLKKGSQVVVQGVCSGYNADELLGSDVILVRCSLIQ